MRTYENSTVCDGCGLEFHWPPLPVGEKKYCCADCSEGYFCSCRDLDLIDDQIFSYRASEISKYEGY